MQVSNYHFLGIHFCSETCAILLYHNALSHYPFAECHKFAFTIHIYISPYRMWKNVPATFSLTYMRREKKRRKIPWRRSKLRTLLHKEMRKKVSVCLMLFSGEHLLIFFFVRSKLVGFCIRMLISVCYHWRLLTFHCMKKALTDACAVCTWCLIYKEILCHAFFLSLVHIGCGLVYVKYTDSNPHKFCARGCTMQNINVYVCCWLVCVLNFIFSRRVQRH